MKKIVLIVLLVVAVATVVYAEFTPHTVLTAEQLNTAFAGKHDVTAFNTYSSATQAKLDAKQSLNLIDTVTGTVYRLTVDNGVLNLEEQ